MIFVKVLGTYDCHKMLLLITLDGMNLNVQDIWKRFPNKIKERNEKIKVKQCFEEHDWVKIN